jgi:hypothetical protein
MNKTQKGFVEEAITKVHEMTGDNLNLNRFKLIADVLMIWNLFCLDFFRYYNSGCKNSSSKSKATS